VLDAVVPGDAQVGALHGDLGRARTAGGGLKVVEDAHVISGVF
jgi:hypothetical protein